MKKKIISIISMIALILTMIIPFSITGFADDSDANGTYRYTSSTGMLEIFNDTQMVDKAENDIAEYPWYSYKSAIEHIIIHDGVTRISDYAFCREDNLVDIVIPESVTSIGTAALAGNDNLKQITLTENVKNIGANAFGFNSKMSLTEGFECICPVGSVAQSWCLKNYVAFSTPFSSSGSEMVNINKAGEVLYWSFVPQYDVKITFSSNSNYDTVGLIYDFDSYVYNDTYSEMKASAINYNDDTGNDLDFTISTTLYSGKRYYLATRFKLSSKTGSYKVELKQECAEHSYTITGLSQDFETGQKQTLELQCSRCNAQDCVSFAEAMTNNKAYCDINNDGHINAKDYAMILKGNM